jgi:hypothetical protein
MHERGKGKAHIRPRLFVWAQSHSAKLTYVIHSSYIHPTLHRHNQQTAHTQDSLKTEENMKRELKVRLALAGFLKDTLTEITNKKVRACVPPTWRRLFFFYYRADGGGLWVVGVWARVRWQHGRRIASQPSISNHFPSPTPTHQHTQTGQGEGEPQRGAAQRVRAEGARGDAHLHHGDPALRTALQGELNS